MCRVKEVQLEVWEKQDHRVFRVCQEREEQPDPSDQKEKEYVCLCEIRENECVLAPVYTCI